MTWLRTVSRLCCLLLIAGLLALGVTHDASAAGEYGRCNYGSGQYGRCNSNTTATTPDGLKVSVNLTDGQVLPRSGYDVIITPLNGAGSTFDTADIYIDGQKVASVTPSANGTATWHWDTTRYPGNNVQIIVTDAHGQTVTLKFTIQIAKAATLTPSVPIDGAGDGSSNSRGGFGLPLLGSAISKMREGVERFVKVLPQPVVRAFPYLLFALLLVEIIILLLQTQRELRALRTVQELAKREREMLEAKKTFTQLVSHYLRTPLTILQGGTEIMQAEKSAPEITTAMQRIINELREQIEGIIAKISGDGHAPSVVSGDLERIRPARYVAVWLPVVMIGVVAAAFVYLAHTVTDYDAGVVEVFLQGAVYSLLIAAILYTFRRWQLHRHDTAGARHLLDDQITLQAQRDAVIQQAAQNLHQRQTELDRLLGQLPAESKNAEFVHKGARQLQTVIDKFVIASQLQGSRSSEPYVPTQLSSLMEQARPAINATAEKKNLQVSLASDMQLQVQSTRLLVLVLQHLLSNAAAYSGENGRIEVAGEPMETGYAVQVTDHGTGIAKEKLTELFQPFYRPDGAEEFSHEGMGFSLYLDKLIMAHLGGELDVVSAVGKGTTVEFGWPVTEK